MEYANGRGVFPGGLADAQVVAVLGQWRPEPALPAGWMATSVAGTPRAMRELFGPDGAPRSLTESPSVSELAARYEMSFAAVQKHVAVLERAGLVRKRANGREQRVSTDHARLQRASQLLDHFEAIWRQRVAQLDEVLLPKGE